MITLKPPDKFRKNFKSIDSPYRNIFWDQNKGSSLGSSISGSRDIKRFRPRQNQKKFFFVFRNQGVMQTFVGFCFDPMVITVVG